MGLYATLIDAEIACPNCGVVRSGDWQFQYGSVGNLPTYRLGDFIEWNTPQQFGWKEVRDVSAVAYPTFEPFCLGCTDVVVAEVRVVDNQVMKLENVTCEAWKRELFFVGAERIAYLAQQKN